MSKLKELIENLCPNGVEYKQLKDIGNVTIGEFVHKNNQREDAIYPVFNGGTSYTGFYDQYNNEGKKILISARGANAGFVNKMEGKYWAGNSCYSIGVLDESQMNWNYIYYFMKNNEKKLLGEQQTGSIPAISKKQIEEFRVPVPPLKVQDEIARVLDNFTLLLKKLSEELNARQRQYEYYIKELMNNVRKIEKKKIYEVTIWDKKFNSVENFKQPVIKKYPTMLAVDLFKMERENGNIFLLSTGEQTGWTTEEIAGKNISEGEVVTIPWGKSRPLKEVMKYYKGKFVTGDNRIATSNDIQKLNNKYLYYWLITQNDKIDKLYRGAGIQHPNMRNVLDLEIELPSIDDQRKIVHILDRFDQVCNDNSKGLPAEIKARQKQYEYYRNKLLTFKELAVNEDNRVRKDKRNIKYRNR